MPSSVSQAGQRSCSALRLPSRSCRSSHRTKAPSGLRSSSRVVGTQVPGRVERPDPAAMRLKDGDPGRARLACGAGLGLLPGGGDEGADQALVGDGGLVDLLRVGLQVLRVTFQGDRGPAGAAAVTAVHGGQHVARRPAEGGLRLRRRFPVPAEGGPVADQPDDPAQRPEPQVGLDVQERPVAGGAGVREERGEPGERDGRRAGVLPERRPPRVRATARQVFEDLVRCRRVVAEDPDERVGEDVAAQDVRQFLG